MEVLIFEASVIVAESDTEDGQFKLGKSVYEILGGVKSPGLPVVYSTAPTSGVVALTEFPK